MSRMSRFLLLLTFVALAVVPVAAQVRASLQSPADTGIVAQAVTAMVSGDGVRFAALALARRIRLEVLSAQGVLLYDSGFRPGNLFEWGIVDQQGSSPSDGLYGCLITVEDLQGRITYRQGAFQLSSGKVTFHRQLAGGSSEAGIASGEEDFPALLSEDPLPFTIVSHDGQEGWIESGSGGLSFYAGGGALERSPTPHLRLTTNGDFGIGVADPKARLDVAGVIKTSEGIQFADGTILKMDGGQAVLVSGNDTGAARVGQAGSTPVSGRTGGNVSRLLADRGISPVLAVDGSGTAGSIVKWTTSTTLGDSVIAESGGNVGVGTANPSQLLEVRKDQHASTYLKVTNADNTDGSSRSRIALIGGTVTQEMQSIATDGGYFGTTSNHPFYIYTNSATRAAFDKNGNVGIGTLNPSQLFEVRRDQHASTYMQVTNTDNTDATSRARISLVGGTVVQEMQSIAKDGGYFGTTSNHPFNIYTNSATRLTIDTAGKVGIGTTTPSSKLTVAGDIESTTAFKISGSSVISIAGTRNVFAGSSAGSNNTTGSDNAFFGNTAGAVNTTGGSNSFFGQGAGLNNTASDNSFFGRNAGYSSGTGGLNSFFGRAAGYSNGAGTGNAFFGGWSGSLNTANANSFFGTYSGQNNSAGTGNSFFGYYAGNANTTGVENSFFGQYAGKGNLTGSKNSFFGQQAGRDNQTGTGNAFFGTYAGVGTNSGSDSFFGYASGQSNSTGGFNTFLGAFAGFYNTTGEANTFVGDSTGYSISTSSGNSVFGKSADGAPGISNATAIGARARVSQSNSLVLGSIAGVNGATANVSVGIGTTAPRATLDVQGGDLLVGSPGQGIILISPDGTKCLRLTVDNSGALAYTPQACP
jgi:hypothetical protein